jgi:hypothetical protein
MEGKKNKTETTGWVERFGELYFCTLSLLPPQTISKPHNPIKFLVQFSPILQALVCLKASLLLSNPSASANKKSWPLGSHFEKPFYTTKFLRLVLYDEGQGFVRKAAVYLFVVLSLLSLGLTFLPMGYGQTQNVKIINCSYYFDPYGYLDEVGLVKNVGTNTLNPVDLNGAVYAPNRELVSSSFCQVWVSYLMPGQEAPFYIEFPPPQSTNVWLASYVGNITLTVAQANATSSYQYQGLKIISSSGSIGTTGNYKGAYLVNGVIENYGTQAATNVTVVGAFFNSTGTVVGAGYTDYLTPQVLVPGATTTFQIAAFDLNQSLEPASLQIHSYQLLVQTELPILNGTSSTATPNPSIGTSPSTSSTSSPSSSAKPGGNSKNPSIDTTIYVIVISVVILAVAAAAALLVLRRNKPHMTVKEVRKARKRKTP